MPEGIPVRGYIQNFPFRYHLKLLGLCTRNFLALQMAGPFF